MRRKAKEQPRKSKPVQAPNIIIAPEHQSAPKSYVRPSPFVNPASGHAPVVHRGDYDSEMDLPEYAVNHELRVMDKSTNQNVDAAIEQYEKNYNDPRSKATRWKGQERWQGKENEEMRLVHIMHPNTFIRKLNAAGIPAAFDTERQRYCRVWLNDFSRVGRIGVNAWIEKVPTTITTLQYPCGPEWTIMRFNEYNVPTNERYRGWRTALLNLIQKNVITEEEAHRAFGEPMGPAATFYREQLYLRRRICMGLETQ